MTNFLRLVKCLFVAIILSCSAKVEGQRGWGARFGRAPILERFAWKILDWNYPNEISRQQAIASGDYQPENALPVGVEVWRDKLFVTVPRWKNGKFFGPREIFFFYSLAR